MVMLGRRLNAMGHFLQSAVILQASPYAFTSSLKKRKLYTFLVGQLVAKHPMFPGTKQPALVVYIASSASPKNDTNEELSRSGCRIILQASSPYAFTVLYKRQLTLSF